MNAFLLTANLTRSQLQPVPGSRTANRMQNWSTCLNLIALADNLDVARKRFEESLRVQPEGENPVQTDINKIISAPFIDQLLTESEAAPLDWPQIAKQGQSDIESIPGDDFEQGYWVDVNAVVRPSGDLETLRKNLPEDVDSGLNWAEDKRFFFILSVLSPPPPPPPEPVDEEGAGDMPAGEGEEEASFPEMVEKEAAVLIRARNSAVAAWLWRNYAADTKLARLQIRIDPWCGVVGVNADKEAVEGDAKTPPE
jgi:hypothetical protein